MQLADDVEVAGVPGVLLQHVKQDPPQPWGAGGISESAAHNRPLLQAVRLNDRASGAPRLGECREQ